MKTIGSSVLGSIQIWKHLELPLDCSQVLTLTLLPMLDQFLSHWIRVLSRRPNTETLSSSWNVAVKLLQCCGKYKEPALFDKLLGVWELLPMSQPP